MLHARAARIVVVSLLLIVASLLVWLVTRPTFQHDSGVPPMQSVAPTTLPIAEHTDAGDRKPAIDASAAAAPVAVEPTAPKKRPSPARETPDLQAKAPLDFLVVDEKGQPVFDAEIALRGMRSESDRGSWYGYRGEKPTARTNAEGKARIEAWVWVNVDGKTRGVDVEVSHPDHPPFRDSSLPVGPGEHKVQLAPSSRVVVHAYTGSPALFIGDISIAMERGARVPSTAWMLEGTDWVTTRLAAGLHSIQVSSPAANPQLFSEVTDFTVIAGETKELTIELFPAVTLEGQLAEEVPRPIVDGHVLVAVRRADFTDSHDTIVRHYESGVNADGTFSIPNLPHGRAYLFALTRGWCSPPVKADFAHETGTRFSQKPSAEDEARALDSMGTRALVLQRTVLPQTQRPLIVTMVQTGIIEIVVRDERGVPVPDVNAGVSPNYSVPDVGSTIVPWREWHVRSDAQGLVRIIDVPPEGRLSVAAGSEKWRLRARDRHPRLEVSVRSGDTAHLELIVEPNDPTKK